MDFEELLRTAETSLPTEPRELYEQLPKKAPGYGYLRDVQAQVLTEWDRHRTKRDIVVKVNTGGGKTIDGLVMLQSYLNEGIIPALYVAPDNYLVAQVVAEAKNLGIATVTDPESPRYTSGDAIAVVNAAKLFNGQSVFSENRDAANRVPIGAVVIDDAHSIMATLRAQLSITIGRSSDAFDELLSLFADDIKLQSPDALLDVQENVGGGIARVPFWSLKTRVDDVRSILRSHAQDQDLKYALPGVRDVLHLSRVVFTRHAVTIVPFCPPVGRISNFADAQRRVFLTATLANDGLLVTDFDVDPESVRNPIHPLTAGDIGERMILAPEEINSGISAADVRSAVAKLSAHHNTLVILPSDPARSLWSDYPHEWSNAENLEEIVERMRKGYVGLVLMANKYDGIDLPSAACRIVVLDGLPQAFSGDDRLTALLQSASTRIDDRQIQRLEQGMGRAVRSNEDHCVVFLIGRRLAQLTVDPRTVERFSPATQAQLRVSRVVAKGMQDTPLKNVMKTAQQALDRDEAWVTYAKRALRNIEPPPARVDIQDIAQRRAFDAALQGDPSRAARALADACTDIDDERTVGMLQEQQAAYVNLYDPTQAQQILAEARAKNPFVLRPLGGINFRAIGYEGSQAQKICERLTGMYGTPAAMRVAVEGFIDRLSFDPETTEEFEQGILELGLFLGLGSQRPEHELNSGGPDNLWAIEPGTYWVIEAKSGVTTETISKHDAGQLGQSMQWFGKKYPADKAAIPVMIHPALKLHKLATAVAGMRVLNVRGVSELTADVRAFSEGLAIEGWTDPEAVSRLLEGNGLTSEGLSRRLRPTTGGTG